MTATATRMLLSISAGIWIATAYALSFADTASRPFPQHVQYAGGTIKPALAQAVLDNDVRRFYRYWKKRYLLTAGSAHDGTPMYRVSYGSVNPARTVSEGQGYGMLIIALMAGYEKNAQNIMDGLWAFVRAHPSTVDRRLMAWETPGNPQTGIDAAFDGDADIAHALFLADAQWGSTGNINYQQQAQQLIMAISQSMIGRQSRLPMLGDWVKQNGEKYNQYTPRSSDFMPAHFRAWYRLTGNRIWKDVLLATQRTIDQVQRDYSPNTGLLPDFLTPVSSGNARLKPVLAHFLEGPDDGHYEYNAGRVPWRIGTDALLSGNAVSRRQAGKIAEWIFNKTGGNALAIQDGYRLDGRALHSGNSFTSFFAAPFGVAAMTQPGQQAFLDAIYQTVRQRHEDYYEDTVTLLCLILMSGNYWNPANRAYGSLPAIQLLLSGN